MRELKDKKCVQMKGVDAGQHPFLMQKSRIRRLFHSDNAQQEAGSRNGTLASDVTHSNARSFSGGAYYHSAIGSKSSTSQQRTLESRRTVSIAARFKSLAPCSYS